MPARAGVASTSQPAIRWAADQSAQPASGDQPARGRMPEVRVGSNTQHGPCRRAPAEGGGGQIVLDRRGDDRTAPFEQGRHGQAGGLAGLGRADAPAPSGGPRWPADPGAGQPLPQPSLRRWPTQATPDTHGPRIRADAPVGATSPGGTAQRAPPCPALGASTGSPPARSTGQPRRRASESRLGRRPRRSDVPGQAPLSHPGCPGRPSRSTRPRTA